MNIGVNLVHYLKNHTFGDLSKTRSLSVLLRNIFQVLKSFFIKKMNLNWQFIKHCPLGVFI